MSQPIDRNLIWQTLRGAAAILVRLVFNLQVRGTQHLPASGGVLIVANHQSFLDPVVLGVMFNRPMAYLADAYLFKFKPFGWLIRKLHAFPINTGKGDIAAMKEMIRLLQAGEILTVFPEGTRTSDGKLQTIEGGVALAIRRARVPVMPAIIVGAYEAFPRQSKIPRVGKVRVIFDKPRQMHDLKSEQIIAEIDQAFRKLFSEAMAWRANS
jgi:1-acyl-sn-glycerol-3-phosphate acyltransferase